jgi:hypothetical protein
MTARPPPFGARLKFVRSESAGPLAPSEWRLTRGCDKRLV